MNAGKVIERLMAAYATTDEETLALQINRDVGTLRTWRSRDLIPLSVLVEASRATNYSVEWLRGDADAPQMASRKTPADDRKRAILTDQEHDLLERFRALPSLLRGHVESTALLAEMAYSDRKAYHEHESKLHDARRQGLSLVEKKATKP